MSKTSPLAPNVAENRRTIKKVEVVSIWAVDLSGFMQSEIKNVLKWLSQAWGATVRSCGLLIKLKEFSYEVENTVYFLLTQASVVLRCLLRWIWRPYSLTKFWSKKLDCGTAWTLLSLQPSSLEKATVEPSCWMAGTTQDLNLAWCRYSTRSFSSAPLHPSW